MPSSDVLTGLFSAAYDGNIALVKSVLKNNGISADISDPIKVRSAAEWGCFYRVEESMRVMFPAQIGACTAININVPVRRRRASQVFRQFLVLRGLIIASLSTRAPLFVVPDAVRFDALMLLMLFCKLGSFFFVVNVRLVCVPGSYF